MKETVKKLFAGKTARILIIAGAALLLLLLCWAVFGRSEKSTATSAGYTPTVEETRLSAILSQIEGAGTVNAVITEEEGVPVSAVIFFDGTDGILTRLRLTQAAAASLNIAENRVLVYPAGK